MSDLKMTNTGDYMSEQPVMKEGADGSRYWYLNGQRHRTDGPAVEWASGTREWYLNGKLHRTDGPAVERPNGTREWWVNDQLHRTDGPAVELASGARQWYLNGKEYTYEEWRNKLAEMTNTSDCMSDTSEDGKWKGYPSLSLSIDPELLQKNTISVPKYAGYWLICENFRISILEDKKPTPEQIKNTQELLGWEWKEYE